MAATNLGTVDPLSVMWTEKQIENFVSKLPRPPRTSHAQVKATHEIDYAALKQIITCLMENPARILPTQGGLVANTVGQVRITSSLSDHWDTKITTLRKIPDFWWVQWIMDASGGRFSKQQLHRIVETDIEDFWHLIEIGLQLPLNYVLPTPCMNKRICARWLNLRATAVGGRLKTLANNWPESGKIDYKVHGAYTFEWDENGVASKCLHTASGTSICLPDHVRISKLFTLAENWSDASAHVSLAPSTYLLRSLFASDIGPNAYLILKTKDENLTKIAVQQQTEIAAQEDTARAGAVVETPTILKEVKDKKRKALTTKAREARQTSKITRAKGRTISLAD